MFIFKAIANFFKSIYKAIFGPEERVRSGFEILDPPQLNIQEDSTCGVTLLSSHVKIASRTHQHAVPPLPRAKQMSAQATTAPLAKQENLAKPVDRTEKKIEIKKHADKVLSPVKKNKAKKKNSQVENRSALASGITNHHIYKKQAVANNSSEKAVSPVLTIN